ncbi:AEC family transporter [Pontibacterium granulatum]|uniref:AEC family transporter n=1 Tax=Pontibacterium granulatum TaxID=2036029 RepID=UPI00249A3C1F|nr:AEC family transporter [Pontibacterium granulatum]MDI3325132.1 AEC family transporter [Pontibacterium granulatum]
MAEIVHALWPVFALIMLGYLARRTDFPGAAFWPLLERLIYFVLFPVLLVDRLAQADMRGVPLEWVLLAVLLLVVAGSVLCYLVRPGLRLSGPEFTSLYQGGIRFNTYLGLAITAALLGDQAMAYAAVIIALLIPTLNVTCVLVFSLHTGGRFLSGRLVKNLLANPLIVACLLGLALNLSGGGLPASIASVTDLLSRTALPLGLLAVGAGLSFKVLLDSRLAMLVSAGIKLVLMPLVGWGIALLLGFEPLLMQVFVLFAALPTATSAYILARQLGGDHAAMAGMITGQTLISVITLPIVLQNVLNFSG